MGQFVLTKAIDDIGDFKWLAFFNTSGGGERAVGEAKRPDEAVARLWLILRRSGGVASKLVTGLLGLEAEALKSPERQGDAGELAAAPENTTVEGPDRI